MNSGKQSVVVMWCWIAEKRLSCFCFQTWAASDFFFFFFLSAGFWAMTTKTHFLRPLKDTRWWVHNLQIKSFWQSLNGQFTPKSKPHVFPLTLHTLRCCLSVQAPRKTGGGSLNKLNQTCCANYPMISACFKRIVKWADITAQLRRMSSMTALVWVDRCFFLCSNTDIK